MIRLWMKVCHVRKYYQKRIMQEREHCSLSNLSKILSKERGGHNSVRFTLSKVLIIHSNNCCLSLRDGSRCDSQQSILRVRGNHSATAAKVPEMKSAAGSGGTPVHPV
jgi:hypothetical protein